MSRPACTLVLRENGTAELLGANGVTLWASDSDEDFADTWAGTMFLNESDVEELLEYLVEAGQLTEYQADHCEIVEDSLEGADTDEGEPLEGELGAEDGGADGQL